MCLHTLKSSRGFRKRRRRVWAAWAAGELGGPASPAGAGRLGLPVSPGELEPEQAPEASLEDQGVEIDVQEALPLDRQLLSMAEVLSSDATLAAAFLTTNGESIQYLTPCVQHDLMSAFLYSETCLPIA